jgi:DNA invertase Pin-like site-specific DNA recombinase
VDCSVPRGKFAKARLTDSRPSKNGQVDRRKSESRLTAARRAGRTGGGPPKLTDDDIEAAKAMLANLDIGVTQIVHRLGVSPATLYRYRRQAMPGR